jgi:hypothetical protein
MPNGDEQNEHIPPVPPVVLTETRSAAPRKIFLYAIPVGVAILLLLLVRATTLDAIKKLSGLLPNFSVTGAEYFSLGFALVGGFVMLLLALSFLPDYDRARLALMLEISGAGVGWILGTFFSPTSQSEQQTFLNAKTAIVGVVSGYVLSKLQTIFDKAVADGKILNQTFFIYGLIFFVPLTLTTTAVYNVRAYQDQTVKITSGKGSELGTTTDKDGKTESTIVLGKSALFVAEARFATNTAVVWSTDPPDAAHGKIDPNTGEYTAPSEMPDDSDVAIVAMSLGDKTKVNRLTIHLQKEGAKKTAERPTDAKGSQPAAAAIGTTITKTANQGNKSQ